MYLKFNGKLYKAIDNLDNLNTNEPINTIEATNEATQATNETIKENNIEANNASNTTNHAKLYDTIAESLEKHELATSNENNLEIALNKIVELEGRLIDLQHLASEITHELNKLRVAK